MFISSINALTLSPALCASFLKPDSGGLSQSGFFGRFNRGFDKTTRGYRRLIAGLLKRSGRVMLLFLVMGVPIGYAIGLGSVVYILLQTDISLMLVTQQICHGADSLVLLALPFFLLECRQQRG